MATTNNNTANLDDHHHDVEIGMSAVNEKTSALEPSKRRSSIHEDHHDTANSTNTSKNKNTKPQEEEEEEIEQEVNPWALPVRDPYSDKSLTQAVVAFKTPKHTLAAIVRAGMGKSILPYWKTYILGIKAGFYISAGCLLLIIIGSGFNSSVTGVGTSVSSSVTSTITLNIPSNENGIQKLLQAAVFPVCLMLVVWLGAELFTGNLMYLGIACLSGNVKFSTYVINLTFCYLGNFSGCAIFAYFLVYLTQISHDTAVRNFIFALATKKVAYSGWGALVLKGIGCNWLVNIALWNGVASEDMIGKMVGIWWPIFTFVAVGFEHSIANMFYCLIGLMEGVDSYNFGDFIAKNLIPVTIGNILGTGVIMVFQYSVYSSYLPHLTKIKIRHGPKKTVNHIVQHATINAINHAINAVTDTINSNKINNYNASNNNNSKIYNNDNNDNNLTSVIRNNMDNNNNNLDNINNNTNMDNNNNNTNNMDNNAKEFSVLSQVKVE